MSAGIFSPIGEHHEIIIKINSETRLFNVRDRFAILQSCQYNRLIDGSRWEYVLFANTIHGSDERTLEATHLPLIPYYLPLDITQQLQGLALELFSGELKISREAE